ncbi:MAG: hypothetical protein LBV75_05980 [Paludibacter sp.]|jgi:hypothetical protein|nr:hypothetical protein [Paludibacter sp.]
METVKYKASYKSDLANAAGVSSETFRRWLKNDTTELSEMKCSTTAKILPPNAVKYLCEKYSIIL